MSQDKNGCRSDFFLQGGEGGNEPPSKPSDLSLNPALIRRSPAPQPTSRTASGGGGQGRLQHLAIRRPGPPRHERPELPAGPSLDLRLSQALPLPGAGPPGETTTGRWRDGGPSVPYVGRQVSSSVAMLGSVFFGWRHVTHEETSSDERCPDLFPADCQQALL